MVVLLSRRGATEAFAIRSRGIREKSLESNMRTSATVIQSTLKRYHDKGFDGTRVVNYAQ